VHGAGTIIGDTQGNTFHYEPDQALMLALFASMLDARGETIPGDSAELVRSFERLIDELYAHSVQQSTLIGNLLLVFIERELMGNDPGAEIRPLGNIDGPEFANFFLPFFMSARKRG
jgi:hypothetical protein